MYEAVDDGFDDPKRSDPLSHRTKKVTYPPRLMVDFTSLGMEALKRYAQFYNVTVRDDFAKDDVAALVARHFDAALDVDEDDSIIAFIQRVRNGERNATNKRSASHMSDKDRKLGDKKQRNKKSASRKRQRDYSGTGASSGSTSNGATSASAAGHGNSSSSSHSARTDADDRKAASAASNSGASSSSLSAPPSASSSSAPSSKNNTNNSNIKKSSDASKKKNDKDASGNNGEDNELYCICNLPSYGNMIACDGKKCPNPSQWYHLECVGFSDGRHPDTWLCPECDPKGFAAYQKKKNSSGGGGGSNGSSKPRSKSPGSSNK